MPIKKAKKSTAASRFYTFSAAPQGFPGYSAVCALIAMSVMHEIDVNRLTFCAFPGIEYVPGSDRNDVLMFRLFMKPHQEAFITLTVAEVKAAARTVDRGQHYQPIFARVQKACIELEMLVAHPDQTLLAQQHEQRAQDKIRERRRLARARRAAVRAAILAC